MPNIIVIAVMTLIFGITIFIGDKISKRFPEYPYAPALAYVFSLLLMTIIYLIGKNI